MNSNTRGTKNERGEVMMPKPEPKTEKERHLYSLLQLVSDKIRERFVNLKACFRYLDTNHTQSISLNEWAQGIDVMRLRISFEDIKTLFNYLDREGSGMLKYENFTYLLEERWRGIDPIEATLNQMKDTLKNPMEPHD
jgi:Ca2+-binding EF-hand superfamily protein